MDFWFGVYTFLFCFTLANALVGSVWLTLWRDKHPIRGHSLLLTLACVATICVLTLLACAANMDLGVSCTALLVGYNFKVANTNYYIARIFRMFVLYTSQQEKGSYGHLTTHIPELELGSNGVETPHYLTPRVSRLLASVTDFKLFVVATCSSVILSVLISLPYIQAGRYDEIFISSSGFVAEPCEELGSLVTYFTILVGFGILLFVLLAYLLRRVHDGFMIKAEFARIVTTAISVVVIGALPGRIQRQQEVMWTLVVVENIILYFTGAWKVWLSYRSMKYAAKSTESEKGEQKLHSNSKFTLQDVLADDQARKIFKEHLQREWSVENLMFYEAVDQLKDLWKSGTLDSDAKRSSSVKYIIETYIDDDSPSCVNINSCARNRILSVVDEGELIDDIFDDAQHQVFNLMKQDSFGRFALRFKYDELFGQPEEAARERSSVSKILKAPSVVTQDAAPISTKFEGA